VIQLSSAVELLALLALASPAVASEAPAMSLYDLSAQTLDGKPQALSAYKGKVVLVVNTASECGYTPQYAGLEKLYQQTKEKGFVILGFPSNDFGSQEPGDSAQIAKFCETKYHVHFPMFEKVKVKGDGKSPIYVFLTGKQTEPKWNFHKYLVGKDGQVIAAFPSRVEPDSPELKQAIEAALK
jgi:glutathione peroxidase